MFNQENFKKIKSRVVKAVTELYNTAIENQKYQNDIVLFYSDAHYDSTLPENYNKFIVGTGIEGIDDYPRIHFLIDFMRSRKEKDMLSSWDQEKIQKFKKYTINLELMMYTHLWEAKRSLTLLTQLCNLIQTKPYQWDINIPWNTKHNYIKNEIEQIFLDHTLDAGKIIQESYHSQLKNAFLHGNYTFNKSGYIKLNNYRDTDCKYNAISFDKWEKKFLNSVLLHFEILFQKRQRLIKFGSHNSEVIVWLPKNNGTEYYNDILKWSVLRKKYIWKRKHKY